MKEVLIYENRKTDPIVWDISTKKLREAAFLKLFKLLHDEWGVYSTGYWGDDEREQAQQKALYDKAEGGDGHAAEALLKMRQSYEYETYHVSEVETS